MNHNHTQAFVDLLSGKLSGANVLNSERTLGQLEGIFANEAARKNMDLNQLVYAVQSHEVVLAGTAGGLFFGTSNVFPGEVDGEYFMTKGHFHERAEAAEYYWCIQGEGALILMDENRHCWVEWLRPGTLHYIPGYTAHRLANTGKVPLRVGACWPADAGHDYGTIMKEGFSARLMNLAGVPTLVPNTEE